MTREVEVIGKAIKGVRILEDKATGVADEFDMDGRRGMPGMFPFSLTFHWEPRTSYRICKSQHKNENVKPLVRNTLGISRQGEWRRAACSAQDRESGGGQPAQLEVP